MRKIHATSIEDVIPDDRITAYISSGHGNSGGLPEIHIHVVDPVTGQEVRAWFAKDEILAAVLDPHDEPVRLAEGEMPA